MPRHEARFAVNAAPEALWRFLRDFESLCACIPGVERVRVVDPRTVELTVRERIGAVPLVVDLIARIEEEEPPRRLRAVATAKHLTMAMDVALRPTGAGAELVSAFEVKGEGPMKPVVDRLFERRAAERAAQFAVTLENRFGAGPAAQGGGAGRSSARGWLRRLVRWLFRSRRSAR
jgi:carbon monoxide dehydrogenase subunit G